MHYSLQESYAHWLSDTDGLREDGLGCIDPDNPPNATVLWLVQSINGVLPFIGKIFDFIDAYYLLQAESGCNASVLEVERNHASIVVNDGCGEFFLNWANGLGEQLYKVIDDPIERALLEMWGRPSQFGKPMGINSIGAEAYGIGAVTCLLAHELGHVHEMQFRLRFRSNAEKDGRYALINHGSEFAADYWSIWTAADVLKPFIKIVLDNTYEADRVEACKRIFSTIILSAFACVEPFSLLEKWEPKDPAAFDTHPAAASRLLNAAVALTEWWTERSGEADFKTVSAWCVESLSRVLATCRQDHSTAGFDGVGMLTELLQRYDESKDYMTIVRETYLDCFKEHQDVPTDDAED